MTTARVIYNCHTHIFHNKQVPENYLPFGLIGQLRKPKMAALFKGALQKLNPIANTYSRLFSEVSKNNLLNRVAAFLEIAQLSSQEDVLKQMQSSYPQNTKFVVLPIDMDYMGSGSPQEGYLQQLSELKEVYKKHPQTVLPFVAVDPRRPGIDALVNKVFEEDGFWGIKIYPACGFFPFDERLYKIYDFAEKNQIPIITHCSPGGLHVKYKGFSYHPRTGKPLKGESHAEFAQNFTDPSNYDHLLKDFPNLKLCFAHFGGNVHLERFLAGRSPSGQVAWTTIIINLMKQYPGVYADVSYSAYDEKILPLLKVLINTPVVGDKILFGTDYFVVRVESTDREFSIRTRGLLGEPEFWKIAETNPQHFLKSEIHP